MHAVLKQARMMIAFQFVRILQPSRRRRGPFLRRRGRDKGRPGEGSLRGATVAASSTNLNLNGTAALTGRLPAPDWHSLRQRAYSMDIRSLQVTAMPSGGALQVPSMTRSSPPSRPSSWKHSIERTSSTISNARSEPWTSPGPPSRLTQLVPVPLECQARPHAPLHWSLTERGETQ